MKILEHQFYALANLVSTLDLIREDKQIRLEHALKLNETLKAARSAIHQLTCRACRQFDPEGLDSAGHCRFCAARYPKPCRNFTRKESEAVNGLSQN